MNLSMLEKVMIYFVCKTKGYITKPQLVKFLYLADLAAVKWTEQQLTDLDWRYCQYGPWNEDIDRTLVELRYGDIFKLSEQGNAILIQPGENCPEIKALRLSKGLELMLRNIQKEWAGLNADKFSGLLEYVYQTEPMVEAKAKHTPEEKAPLNLYLEHEKVLAELGV
ncbi:DUF4065 domain-containing protein [Spirulina sp. CS-785/01]|uniref:type II toxin-antitoxin system antitoxin SocA domain-containing protein n=1 Tax=Spirulina sp. CS-785/01 TaxID=3021716 RepID=UPI00232E089C|nr:type II toxin-antitoxin system antitoxin SocA domain-containing protein [Spirulina sp. CS-785/01]MDB9311694.1 DUF4065 domain-containing protein [Spirulina sp. CS-785/01]